MNTELIALYWRIGKTILEQQRQAGWAAKSWSAWHAIFGGSFRR
nr:hypothetical protein [Agrococcus baldri]